MALCTVQTGQQVGRQDGFHPSSATQGGFGYLRTLFPGTYKPTYTALPFPPFTPRGCGHVALGYK